jgi:signal peptidase I
MITRLHHAASAGTRRITATLTFEQSATVGRYVPFGLWASVRCPRRIDGVEAPPRPPARPEPGVSRRRPSALVVVGAVFLVALTGHGVMSSLFHAYKVPSSSMSPEIARGDRMLVRMSGHAGVERGDAVVYRAPDGQFPETRLSRVVGLGGEQIEGRDGHVLIDGAPLDEGYLPDDVSTDDFAATPVPAGAVFLISDNRANARDSRALGPIDDDLLVGRVSLVNVPVDQGLLGLAGVLGLATLVLALQRVQDRRPGAS